MKEEPEAEKLIQEYLSAPITSSWEFDPNVDIIGDLKRTVEAMDAINSTKRKG